MTSLATLESLKRGEELYGRKYWAIRNKQQVGPVATREEAAEAFRAAFPHKGPEYMRTSKKCQFLTGYGEFGAHFSIQWHNA
jgi:hypothetical protein